MSTSSKHYFKLVNYIKSNQEKFYRVAFSYTKSREDALDIVQESVYKGLKSVGSLKKEAYMTTWFYRILINTSISHYNSKKVITLVPELDERIDCAEVSTGEYLDLYDAIDALEGEDKTLIILKYFEDKTFKDISRIMEINESTLKTRLYKILDYLKKELSCEVIENEY